MIGWGDSNSFALEFCAKKINRSLTDSSFWLPLWLPCWFDLLSRTLSKSPFLSKIKASSNYHFKKLVARERLELYLKLCIRWKYGILLILFWLPWLPFWLHFNQVLSKLPILSLSPTYCWNNNCEALWKYLNVQVDPARLNLELSHQSILSHTSFLPCEVISSLSQVHRIHDITLM